MPAFAVALIAALASAAGHLVGRVLIALGVQFVTYQGIDVLLQQIVTGIISTGGIPGAVAWVVGFFRLPECAAIITGAITAKFFVGGLVNGSITRMVIR